MVANVETMFDAREKPWYGLGVVSNRYKIVQNGEEKCVAAYYCPWITSHICDHSCRARVPLIKISASLGHASVNTTFEYYCDVMDENEQIISFMNSTFLPERSE